MKRILFLTLLFAVAPAFAVCDFKADTASQTFLIGPFLDQTDGITAETALTVLNTDIRLSKAGGNMAAKNSGGGTHDEEGLYQITLDATDTNTEGILQISVQDVANHVPVWHECVVLGADFYDLKYGTTSLLTSTMTGLQHATTINTVTPQTVVVLTDGPSNNDGIRKGQGVYFKSATEDCITTALDYVGSTTTLTVADDCSVVSNMTLAGGDEVFIYVANSGPTIQTLQDDSDITTGTSGVVIDDNAITASAYAIDAIEADAIAANAIGASELAANAIGPSEMANDTIDANALASDAVDEIWDEVVETAGATYTGRCLLAMLGSYAAGAFNTVGNTTTYKDTSNASTRIVGTTTASGRGTMSITCP